MAWTLPEGTVQPVACLYYKGQNCLTLSITVLCNLWHVRVIPNMSRDLNRRTINVPVLMYKGYLNTSPTVGAHCLNTSPTVGAHYLNTSTTVGAHYLNTSPTVGAHYLNTSPTVGAH
jgi:hypothetical protein